VNHFEEFSIPKIFGLDSKITLKPDITGKMKNFLEVKFHIKRKDIGKYINDIQNDIPVIRPATIEFSNYIALKIDKNKLISYYKDKLPDKDIKLIVKNSRYSTLNGKVLAKCLKYKSTKKVINGFKEHTDIMYDEYLCCTFSYPLMFSTNFYEVINKVNYLRECIVNLVSLYKAQDRINKKASITFNNSRVHSNLFLNEKEEKLKYYHKLVSRINDKNKNSELDKLFE
jgi:hypothetical protein